VNAKKEMTGVTAIVTGAGAGIGQAIALELAECGAAVAILDRDVNSAAATADIIAGSGGQGLAVEADVADSASINAAVSLIKRDLGTPTVVVNNAGILDDFLPVLDTSEELWDRVLSVNLKGMFLMARATLPLMIAGGAGVFVNIASGAGLVAGMGGTAYTSSKHGVIGLTKQMASDYGSAGIRANAICPGSIDTELSREFLKDNPDVEAVVKAVPSGRQGQASEIAKLAAFLASPDSAFMTGAAVPIDGGWTVR
jgi:3-oxoacyl-[acyl-carrier protein] reductase